MVGGGGPLIEAGHLGKIFSPYRMAAYWRWVLIQGWVLHQIKHYGRCSLLFYILNEKQTLTLSRESSDVTSYTTQTTLA